MKTPLLMIFVFIIAFAMSLTPEASKPITEATFSEVFTVICMILIVWMSNKDDKPTD